MAAGKRAGLVDVKVVSYSDTHSAEKYVIPVANRPKCRPKRGADLGRSDRVARSLPVDANASSSALLSDRAIGVDRRLAAPARHRRVSRTDTYE